MPKYKVGQLVGVVSKLAFGTERPVALRIKSIDRVDDIYLYTFESAGQEYEFMESRIKVLLDNQS